MKIVYRTSCIAFVVPCIHVLKNAQKTLHFHKTNVGGEGMGQCVKCCCTSKNTSVQLPRSTQKWSTVVCISSHSNGGQRDGGSPNSLLERSVIPTELFFFFFKSDLLSSKWYLQTSKYLEYCLWQIAYMSFINIQAEWR